MKKYTLIIVFFVFLIPVLLAILLHSQWLEWRPAGTRNHGELIEPVVPLGPFELAGDRGRVLRLDDLLGRWQLVHLAPGGCDETCLDTLYWLRQVRTAQDRHQPDIGLLLLSGRPLEPGTRDAINALAQDFRHLDGPGGRELIARFPGRGDEPASYILDPAGNIILTYRSGADPNGIRKDLRRLLTWTRTQ